MRIEQYGRFYKTDSMGYLINESTTSNISPYFQPSIDLVKRVLVETDVNDVTHSLYLRGSVPRGLAIPDISDVDMFALTNCDDIASQALEDQVRQKLFQSQTKIDFRVYTLNEALNMPDWYIRFVVKVLSTCVLGIDLGSSIRSFKPNSQILAGYALLEDSLVTCELKLAEPYVNTQHLCSWIAKQIVRAGLAISIDREGRFTPDLYLCYTVFKKWYPNRSEDMLEALDLAINPTSNKMVVKNLIGGLGHWLARECKCILMKNS